MEKTAPSFFSDLNTILQNYLLLEFVKITDPPKSGKNENFTVENLVMSIEWPTSVKEKLQMLSEKTKVFRGHVLEARNKLLAHSDKEAFLEGKIFGEFPEGEDEIFLRTLEEICNLVHDICFGRIFGKICLTAPGDVINLKRCLLYSLAFKELVSKSRDHDEIRLYSILEEIRKQN